MKLLDRLYRVYFFEGVENLNLIIDKKNIKYKKYYKNNTIREAQENCNWVDIVVSGTVVAYSLSENGNATTMFEFNRDSIIGANLILTQSNYPLTFYSKNETEIISVNLEGINELLHNYEFCLKFFKALSINSQNLNKKVFKFHRNTIRENLIQYFKEQSAIQKSKIIELPISKKQLADYFGIQRQSLFRELKNLKEEEFIDISNRKIKLNF